jgi:hypothetical protein
VASSDAELLRTYQPVTIFDPAEQFRPSKVQPFVADSVLERFTGTSWVVVDADPEPGTLPGPGTGVWRLNQEACSPTAAIGGLGCYVDGSSSGGGGDGVYGRAVRSADAIVLQYWFFYYDNTYSYTSPASDFIWQAHEGDWELVNVVLTGQGEPVSVGYSQHCLGQRRAWAAVPRLGTHPVVHVADGSHANYFSAGVHPWNPACIPLQAQLLFAQLGLPLPSDRTGAGEVAGPPEAAGGVTPIHAFGPWVDFPGFWGELQYLHAPVVGTVPFGTSPLGPAGRPIWDDPLAAMAAWPAG